MKLLFFSILIVTFSACKQNESPEISHDSDAKINLLKLNGTWEMTGYYNFVDNKITDSFRTNPGFRQVKMFTDQKVMWSKNVPADSTEWFGYGFYSVDSDQDELTETLEYGSEMMRKIIDEKKEFKYELLLEKNMFSQIEMDSEGNRIYSENYKRIE